MTNKSPVVHSDPEILGGTPVFVGTRVPLRNLFDYLECGHDIDEFLDAFPLGVSRANNRGSRKRERGLDGRCACSSMKQLPRQLAREFGGQMSVPFSNRVGLDLRMVNCFASLQNRVSKS